MDKASRGFGTLTRSEVRKLEKRDLRGTSGVEEGSKNYSPKKWMDFHHDLINQLKGKILEDFSFEFEHLIDNNLVHSNTLIYIESEFEFNDDRFTLLKQKKSASVHYCLLKLGGDNI